MSLFWKLLIANTTVALVMLGVLLFSPAALTLPPSASELAWVGVALVVLIALNAWSLRVTLGPLTDLRTTIESVETAHDVSYAGVRQTDEVGRLAASYNAMIDRLRDERSRSAAAAMQAQESERLRISRELHDEVGQTLTAVLLTLGPAASSPDKPTATLVADAQTAVRTALGEVRGIAARLRPGVLVDLGLVPALTSLASQASQASSLTVTRDLRDVGEVTREQELAIYRVCQEALTNVVRHADASHAHIALRRTVDTIVLTIEDDGTGAVDSPGTGIEGMRERALLVRGHLETSAQPGAGTTVRLEIPVTR